MILELFRLLRPHQWTKQAIVMLPILSLGTSFSITDFIKTLLAAMTFCMAAGAVYIINDFADIKFDRTDPVRKLRPLASGRVNRNAAITLLLVCLALTFVLNAAYSDAALVSGLVLLLYLTLNFVYSKFALKKHNLLGIAIVSSGFSLRFAFGSIFLSIQVSFWALVLLMELSLFMLSIKRFQMSRRNNESILNSSVHEFWLIAAVIFASVFMASFAGFITSPETQSIWGANALLLSTIPLAIGMVRFIEIATDFSEHKQTDVTDIVVRDVPMLTLVCVFVITLFIGRLTVSG
jgi:4-hydroxybenzoate polyprenyltransferase